MKKKLTARPLFIRVSREERALITSAQQSLHFVSMSEWVRTVLLAEAKKVIACDQAKS